MKKIIMGVLLGVTILSQPISARAQVRQCPNPIEVTYEEAQELMQIAWCEAGNQGIDGQRYVMSVVINRVKKRDVTKGRLLNVDSVIDSTEIQLIGVVPEDAKIRLGSMGQGIYKKGQVSYKAFQNIAARLEGISVPLKF